MSEVLRAISVNQDGLPGQSEIGRQRLISEVLMGKLLKKPKVVEVSSTVSHAILSLAPRGLRISDAAIYMGVTPLVCRGIDP